MDEVSKVTVMDAGVARQVTMPSMDAVALRIKTMMLNGDKWAIEFWAERMDPRPKSADFIDSEPPKLALPAGGPWGGAATVRTPESAAKPAALDVDGGPVKLE